MTPTAAGAAFECSWPTPGAVHRYASNRSCVSQTWGHFYCYALRNPPDTEAKVARTVIVTDDLDGSSPAEPVQFTYDGVNWEIDLSAKNREKLQKALQPFLDKAHRAHMAETKTTTPIRTRRSRSTKNGRENQDAIRQWAQENGYKVGDRGRIAKSIIEEYELAQKAKR